MQRIADNGTRVAAHLATVYLATIMEAYVKDAVYELLSDKIRRVNSQLLGDPIPTTEDEDIMIDIEVDDAEKDETRPFHLISKLSRDHVKKLLWHNSVINGIDFLKKEFALTIKNEKNHRKHWEEIKQLRNVIVHGKNNPAHKTFLKRIHDREAAEPLATPEAVKRAIEQIYAFAEDIELGIFAYKHRT